MAPPKPGKKPTSQKKEKVFHPQSRKADQLVRTQLRKGKLADLAKTRNKKHASSLDLYGFFFHAIPSEGVLTLEDLHSIICDIWQPRFDAELESERSSRRKGRPKSTKEVKLEDIKLREAEEYRTGLEVIDLTDQPNVELFRRWDQKEAAYIQQLRFIRISSTTPDKVVISKPGKHPFLIQKPAPVEKGTPDGALSQDMDVDLAKDDDAPLLLEPIERFSSTMMTMDGPL